MSQMVKHKGCFIAFDGGEGGGKTTLITALTESLTAEGYIVNTFSAMRTTEFGKMFRKSVLVEGTVPVTPMAELLSFFADRAQLLAEFIEPAIARGEIVLCDRFTASSMAYQGEARGVGIHAVETLQRLVHGHIYPDINFILDLPPTVGLGRTRGRGDNDRFDAFDLDFHEAVRRSFLRQAETNRQRYKVLDAQMSPQDVLATALVEIDKWLDSTK